MFSFFRNHHSLFLFFFFSFRCALGDPDPSLKFIPNKDQWNKDILFAARIPGGNMVLSPGAFRYYFLDHKELNDRHDRSHDSPALFEEDDDRMIGGYLVEAEFSGANKNSIPVPIGQSKEHYNFFTGSDPSRWAAGIFGYSGVYFPSFYKGIDLKVYASGGSVKYDLIVSPGADPSQIRVRYNGADKLFLDNGNLYMQTPYSQITEKRPFVYQVISGRKVEVESEFVLVNNELYYVFPKGYDACYELVIDPLLIFSTFSGSAGDNWGSTATPGENGKLYSAGVTNHFYNGQLSGPFPATPGAFQVSYGGVYDIGILKYDSTGSQLLYASYLGGNQSESPHSLVVNSQNELIVLGTTSSLNFPVSSNAFDKTYNGGTSTSHVVEYANGSDIFLARISPDGRQLLGSTYIGGSGNDGINRTPSLNESTLVKNYGDQLRGDVITDPEGNIYVSTVTSSANFPAIGGFDLQYDDGGSDALVFKMNPGLDQLIWSSFLGGAGVDACHTIEFDSQKNIFVAGGTASPDFPATPGSFKSDHAGGVDGFVAKISPDGTQLSSCTLTGTALFDQVYFLDLNQDDDVYVLGQSNGQMPVEPAGQVYSNPNGKQFLQKFSNSLSQRLMATVIGSGRNSPDISPTAFLVNECNNIYITGWGGRINDHLAGGWDTSTLGMPVSDDAFQKTTSGSDFYFMVLTEDARQFLYGTYMGGNVSATHVDGGTCRFDRLGIVYHAVCAGCTAANDTGSPVSDFPTTPGAWSRTNKSLNCNNAAFKFDLSSLRAQIRTNSVDYTLPGLSFVCIPDTIRFENKSIGGEIFEWDLGDGTKLTKTDTGSVLHAYKNEGYYMVKLTAIDRGTCKSIDSTAFYLTVYKREIFIQGDDDLCEQSSYTLKAKGGIEYDWEALDGSFTSSLATPVVSPKDTTDYFITVIDHQGCVEEDTVRLNVIPKIVPRFKIERERECSDMPSIHVTSLTDSLMAVDNVFFRLGDGKTDDRMEFDHNYEDEGIFSVTMVAERHGCMYEESINQPVFVLSIPNVITPDGDGLNDFFTVQYGSQEGITPKDFNFSTSLIVYNRWGGVVYENGDYGFDWSGEGLASGVYYFEISIEQHAVCRNWLHIIR